MASIAVVSLIMLALRGEVGQRAERMIEKYKSFETRHERECKCIVARMFQKALSQAHDNINTIPIHSAIVVFHRILRELLIAAHIGRQRFEEHWCACARGGGGVRSDTEEGKMRVTLACIHDNHSTQFLENK
jgi:hypothetical protein